MILERKLCSSMNSQISSPQKWSHFCLERFGVYKGKWISLVWWFDENRFSSRSRIFGNTGPIPIIFGSLESKKIELSFFLGIAMLPLIWFLGVLVTMWSVRAFRMILCLHYPRVDRFSEELFPKSIFVSAMYFMQTVVCFLQPTDRTTRAQFEIMFK